MEENQIPQEPAYARKITNRFIRVALKGDNSAAKYVGGTLLILGIWIIGSFLMLNVFSAIEPALAERFPGFNSNGYFLFAVLGFAVGLLGVWFVINNLHGRSLKTLITPNDKINWKKIILAFSIYFSLTAAIEGGFYYFNPDNYIFQLNVSKFIPLVIISLLFTPVQTSFEEIFFRGYLLQGTSLLFRRTLPALLTTSLLFALAHSSNPEIGKYGFFTMFPFYFGFALMQGFITLFDESLEIPLATHAANNIFTAIFITFEGSVIKTDAIFIQKEMDPAASMPYYFASMFIFLLICSFVFGWWKRKQKPLTAA